ncbi:MAG: hypothetical protein CL927_13085 [Deltaproteobacteria bacterium]|nr:hypothetical protein [Deltaproteobacteria bacterium]HCH64536.1 hypothetical protein [Deltaproteobacteria bacterium]
MNVCRTEIWRHTVNNHRIVGWALLSMFGSVATPSFAQEASGHKDLEQPEAKRPDMGGEGIINGEDAARDDYPMTGGILLSAWIESSFGSGDLQTFICSSTLIAPDVVLTAAHCVDIEMLEYSVTFGFGTLEDVEQVWSRDADFSMYDGSVANQPWPDDAVGVTRTVYPAGWDAFALETGIADNQDIALMFLSEPVLDVRPAILPSAAEGASLSEGLEVAVVGWGQQSHVSGWGSPPAGSYMIKQQGMSFVSELGEPEFKVGEIEGDVRKCHGDSGGPSFAWVGTDSEEVMRLVGVTSHAYDRTDCASTGGVDSRVDFHLNWIDEQMRAACADGTRVWCDEPGILPGDYYDVASGDEDEDTGISGDDGNTDATSDVDGDSSGETKGGCSHALGALSGAGLLMSMFAVGRRRA